MTKPDLIQFVILTRASINRDLIMASKNNRAKNFLGQSFHRSIFRGPQQLAFDLLISQSCVLTNTLKTYLGTRLIVWAYLQIHHGRH